MLILLPALAASVLFFVMALTYYSKYQTSRFKNAYLLEENQQINSKLEESNNKIIQLEKEKSSANEQINYLKTQLKDQEKNREEIVKNARSVMYDLGNKISGQLLEQQKQESRANQKISEENISKTTSNLNEEIKKLVNKVATIDKEVYNSKNTIDLVKNSLLSPKGAGELAEMTLENLLKASNLQEDIDYVMQYRLNYHSHSSHNYRPDALVFLPGGNVMIIDAKASTALMEAEEVNDTANQENQTSKEEEQDPTKQDKNKKLYESITRHFKSLSSKDYKSHVKEYFQQNNMEVNNVFTLMFLPSEQSIEKVTSADPRFLFKAWQQEIFPVGPSGMVNMLNFAKFQITERRRHDNYKVIIEEVKKLLGSCNTLYEHANKLGNNIYNLVGNYDKFAGSFNSNFLSKAKSIEKLGVHSSSGKSLNNSLTRYQIVTSKLEMVDTSPENNATSINENAEELDDSNSKTETTSHQDAEDASTNSSEKTYSLKINKSSESQEKHSNNLYGLNSRKKRESV